MYVYAHRTCMYMYVCVFVTVCYCVSVGVCQYVSMHVCVCACVHALFCHVHGVHPQFQQEEHELLERLAELKQKERDIVARRRDYLTAELGTCNINVTCNMSK